MRYPDGSGLTAKQRAQRERVRFEAAGMFAAGASPAQVARRLRVSRKSACAWHAAWRAGGADTLRSKGPSAYPPRGRHRVAYTVQPSASPAEPAVPVHRGAEHFARSG
jgi:Homeodomain-like domain